MRYKSAWALVALAVFSVQFAQAQEIPAQIRFHADSPVMIESVNCARGFSGGLECIAEVEVTGRGPISAVGLVWRLVFPDGEVIFTRVFSDRSIGPNRRLLQPGQRETIRSAGLSVSGKAELAGTLPQVHVEVDFAEPATGPLWGNRRSPSYLRMLGSRDGYKAAIAYLKSVYGRGGADSLAEELQKLP